MYHGNSSKNYRGWECVICQLPPAKKKTREPKMNTWLMLPESRQSWPCDSTSHWRLGNVKTAGLSPQPGGLRTRSSSAQRRWTCTCVSGSERASLCQWWSFLILSILGNVNLQWRIYFNFILISQSNVNLFWRQDHKYNPEIS